MRLLTIENRSNASIVVVDAIGETTLIETYSQRRYMVYLPVRSATYFQPHKAAADLTERFSRCIYRMDLPTDKTSGKFTQLWLNDANVAWDYFYRLKRLDDLRYIVEAKEISGT